MGILTAGQASKANFKSSCPSRWSQALWGRRKLWIWHRNQEISKGLNKDFWNRPGTFRPLQVVHCANGSQSRETDSGSGLKRGMKNHIFWSEIGSGFWEPCGTPPPKILGSSLPEDESHARVLSVISTWLLVGDNGFRILNWRSTFRGTYVCLPSEIFFFDPRHSTLDQIPDSQASGPPLQERWKVFDSRARCIVVILL